MPPGLARPLWIAAGFASLVLGAIGLLLPLLPTVPFVLLAAFCFSKGSARWERWLVEHPRLGPYVRDWREHHAVPWRAKLLATAMMAISCTGTWFFAQPKFAWIPTAICTAVAIWMWRLPTR
jgi:uncharacterized membrane protein YbaN (DUF454 family)